jgi:hypothetical protein
MKNRIKSQRFWRTGAAIYMRMKNIKSRWNWLTWVLWMNRLLSRGWRLKKQMQTIWRTGISMDLLMREASCESFLKVLFRVDEQLGNKLKLSEASLWELLRLMNSLTESFCEESDQRVTLCTTNSICNKTKSRTGIASGTNCTNSTLA